MRQIRFRFDGQPISETDTPAGVRVCFWKLSKPLKGAASLQKGQGCYTKLHLALIATGMCSILTIVIIKNFDSVKLIF